MDYRKTWIVVANSSLAKIIHYTHETGWKEMKTIEHVESRMKNVDLVSDKEGTTFDCVGAQRHHIDRKTSPKIHEADCFAKELISYLKKAHDQQAFLEIYLIASPAFLGRLRELEKDLASYIRKEIHKDLVHEPLKRILQELDLSTDKRAG